MTVPTPTSPPSPPPAPALRPYEPPRLTGKQSLAQVTLYSFTCAPGDTTCHVGHP